MSELLIQMVPMLLLAGLGVGWAAETASRAGGYGLLPDMVAGVLGSLLAGAGLWAAGYDAGMVTVLLAGGVGAALAVVAQRTLWRAARPVA
jgi:uncharacterized membrane protein YeaQ/YmgE (transglycosylase-associated protein family)